MNQKLPVFIQSWIEYELNEFTLEANKLNRCELLLGHMACCEIDEKVATCELLS